MYNIYCYARSFSSTSQISGIFLGVMSWSTHTLQGIYTYLDQNRLICEKVDLSFDVFQGFSNQSIVSRLNKTESVSSFYGCCVFR